MPHRRLMRANHRCAVVIRQVRGTCSRAVCSPRLCSRAVVRSAFSETVGCRTKKETAEQEKNRNSQKFGKSVRFMGVGGDG